MNAEQANIRFPALGFTPDQHLWGFADLKTLTTCGRLTLKEDLQVGMELIDDEGKRWRVLGLRKIGRNRSLLPWFFWALLAGPLYRVEQTLEVLEPVTLAEVKEMTLRSMEVTAEDWCAEDERELHFDPLVEQVKAAKSAGEIFAHLGLDNFMAC